MTTDPFTEAARAEAERQYWANPNVATTLPGCVGPFAAGAEWARTYLAAQEPTDAEVEAASRTWAESGPTTAVWERVTEERREYTRERMRACLSAARAARRDDTSTTPEQRIRVLHAPDADGNCGHCTRGRVYPVPAPCETVRALAGGGEGR